MYSQTSGGDKLLESPEPPMKIRKSNRLLSFRDRRSDSSGPVFWPRDLLPTTCPIARILTYGYDTRVSHVLGASKNRCTMYEMAWDFLVELEAGRREECSRPLLFVAHSLGGIFVKEALRRSASYRTHALRHFASVFDSTIGMIFFGTPHGGADPCGLVHRIVDVCAKIAGLEMDEHVVQALLPSAERLRELRDEFSPIVEQQNWAVHSFQEVFGVPYLQGDKVCQSDKKYYSILHPLVLIR